MNILYIAHESRLGGANLSLLGMIDEIAKEHNVYVAVPIKKGFLVDELQKRNIPVFYQHFFWWMLAPAGSKGMTFHKKCVYRLVYWNNYLCAFRLRKVVKQNKIDVIHTNSSVISTGGILASMTGVPHVWHIREFGQEDFNFFSVWNYDKMCKFINKKSDRVITISKAIYSKFQDKIDLEKLITIYNGVGEEHRNQKTTVKKAGDIVELLISGRISQEKGQKDAILAVSELTKKGFENFHLSIAGPGDLENLKELVAKMGIGDKVSFLGTVQDMPSLRQRMDVELVCSVCEGFGRVTVEAMMSSNPVIGSDTGGTPELIRSGENGYLYQQGNVEELADKIALLLKQPEEIGRLGKNAYDFATEQFTRKRNADSIEAVYKQLLTEF